MITLMIISIPLAVMLWISLIIKKAMSKKTEMKQSTSPFHCGFTTFKSPLMPFSIQFFTVALLFIIFDIEIAMILSLILATKEFPPNKWVPVALIFLAMMVWGFVLEISKSAMAWMI